MDSRQENQDLSIVFGTKCDAKGAVEKLRSKSRGCFLLRESSIEGLITFSIRRSNKTEHLRFALTPDGRGGLEWKTASSDATKAKEEAAKAKNAFNHIKEHPESLNSLLDIIKQSGLDLNNMVKPGNKAECSDWYNAYTVRELDVIMNADVNRPRIKTGYDSE